MTVLVTDAGFAPDDWTGDFDGRAALDLTAEDDPSALGGRLAEAQLIRVTFSSFADGRGFTIARQLRLMGYSGRLRAAGHVLADQYAMARRAGFDEVEISDDLAARQGEDQWLARAGWQAHDYQARLGLERARPAAAPV